MFVLAGIVLSSGPLIRAVFAGELEPVGWGVVSVKTGVVDAGGMNSFSKLQQAPLCPGWQCVEPRPIGARYCLQVSRSLLARELLV